MNVSRPSWVMTKLDELGTIYCGQSVSEPEVNRVGRGVVYVTGPEQWNGRHIEQNKWTEHPRRLVPQGCIFITVKGAGVGKTFPGIAAAIGRDVYAYNPSNELDAEFIHRAIRYRIISLISEARGDIPGLSREHLADYAVPVPPLAEQRRIITKLDALNLRLARARAEVEKVSKLADRLRAESLKRIFEKLPGSKRIGDISTFVTSGSRGWAKYYSDTGSAFIRVGNTRRRDIKLDLTNLQRVQPAEDSEGIRTALRPGDVVVTITADLGRVGVVLDDLGPAFVNQHVALVRLRDIGIAKWTAWYLSSEYGQAQLLSKDRGITKAGLGLDDIRHVQIPLVGISQREMLLARLESAFARADRLEAEAARAIALLDRLEASILAKAFCGELVPHDPADEPAAALLNRIRAERAAAPQGKRGRRTATPVGSR